MVEDVEQIRSRLKRKPLVEFELPPQRQMTCAASNPRRAFRPNLILLPPATFGCAI
jgi:hypothetical protein